MLKGDQLQQKFLSSLTEKAPSRLASYISEILHLGKESIYRRLRGEVPFSFYEMATLSKNLGISLDDVAGIISPYRSKLYYLHVRDYNELKPIDLNMSDSYISAINHAADSGNSEFGIATNTIPLHISLKHLPIYRVYLLKWKYQFGDTPKNQLCYSNIWVPEKERETYQLYLDTIQRIKYTFFIWDNSIIISLVNDMNFFYKIGIITMEEMCMLKKEAYRMLDTLEYYADYGKFDKTGNSVDTYISTLNFDTSYTYLFSDEIYISMSSVYSLGAFTSVEKEACEEMKKWILGLKKSSMLISGAAQQDKILFFKKQRDFIENNFIDE